MSKYSDKLFLINQKKGTLELNKIEARQIPAYRAIIERDKGGKIKGDPDGRHKFFAFRELYYVYILADPFNMYSILNDDRRKLQALETSLLKQIEGWKPDKLVKAAIEQYKKDVYISPIAYTYLNARKALQSIGKDIKLLNDFSEELRENIRHCQNTLSDEYATQDDKDEDRAKLSTYRKQLSRNNDDILNITKSIPDRKKSLDQLKMQLAEEDSELEQVIGGGMIYDMEDPN